MNKTLLLAGVACLLLTHNAQAEETQRIKPVIGVDYVYSQIDMDYGLDEAIEDKLNAFALSAGVKFSKYLGAEAFYQLSENADKDEYIYTQFQYKAYGLDLIGYVPLNQNFDLIGTTGVAYYDAELKVFGVSVSEKEVGFRLGTGAQYNINDHVSLRLMGRYNYTGIDGMKNMFDVTTGARIYF